MGVGRVVTEREKLKTLINFLTWLLDKLVVSSSKRGWITACEFFHIMYFHIYFIVLSNHAFFGICISHNNFLFQFYNFDCFCNLGLKKYQYKITLVAISFVDTVKWKYVAGTIFCRLFLVRKDWIWRSVSQKWCIVLIQMPQEPCWFAGFASLNMSKIKK